MGRLRSGLAVWLGLLWLSFLAWLVLSANWSPSDPEEWFAFPMPWDDGEPSFVGPLLEAPAGRHGFVQLTQEGDFRFEDGTPVRFWGAAMGVGVVAPPKDLAEKIAARLAKLGFNLVRFRGLDLQLFPPAPPTPAAWTPNALTASTTS